MKTLIDVSSAQIQVDDSGTIVIDDPDSPLIVKVTTDDSGKISDLQVTRRHPSGRITSAIMARLPIAQIQRLATVITRTRTSTPDEAWWTVSAVTKPAGSRHWPDDHWVTVRAVATWAKATKRPGGAATAIADLWGIAKRPTAYRWLARARTHKDQPTD